MQRQADVPRIGPRLPGAGILQPVACILLLAGQYQRIAAGQQVDKDSFVRRFGAGSVGTLQRPQVNKNLLQEMVIFSQGKLIRGKQLYAPFRAEGAGLDAGVGANFHFHHPCRAREVDRLFIRQVLAHEAVPNGAGYAVARLPGANGLVVCVADPDGRYHLWRIANGPAIAHVAGSGAGSARLHCHLVAGNDQIVLQAKLRLAGAVICQNVAEQKSVFRPRHLGLLRHCRLVQNIAQVILNARNGVGGQIAALVGQYAISSGHL